MRKDAFEWEFQNGEHLQREGINVELIRGSMFLISLYVPNVMNPYFLTISVPIVALTGGEKSSRWRKRNKSLRMRFGERVR
jgi:hypothetical protein